MFLLSSRDCDIRRDKSETWARVSARTLAARARAVLRLDARDLLRRCEAPIVYIASSRDSIVPRGNADEIVSLVPSSRRILIDGPHMALYTDPRTAADAICRVLRVDAPVGTDPTVAPLV
jgi:pimeloyl-ACP methyl ester carboxylesterase